MRLKPGAMQIECHPYAQRTHWQEKLKELRIVLKCWYPLGGRASNGKLLRDPIINRIAKAHGKTAAQIIIRWQMRDKTSLKSRFLLLGKTVNQIPAERANRKVRQSIGR